MGGISAFDRHTGLQILTDTRLVPHLKPLAPAVVKKDEADERGGASCHPLRGRGDAERPFLTPKELHLNIAGNDSFDRP